MWKNKTKFMTQSYSTPRSGGQTAFPSCHINDLPNEILSRIFLYIPNNAPLTEWAPSFTHVCRLWRHIALALPYLWTTITFEDFDNFKHWTDLLITRSGGHLLTLDFRVDWPKTRYDHIQRADRYKEAVRQSSNELRRAKRILLELDNLTLDDITRIYSWYQAPELRELSISVTKYWHDDSDSDEDEALQFLSQYPKLSTLSLSGCTIHSDLWKPMLRNLQRLSIINPIIKIALDDAFLKSVARMPLLDYLELSDIFLDISPEQRGSSLGHVKLEFLRLKELHVSSHIASLNAFLGLISTPHLSRFGLNFRDKRFSSPTKSISNLPTFLQTFTSNYSLQGHSRPKIRHIEVYIEKVTGRSFNPFDYSGEDNNPIFSLTFAYKKTTWEFIDETLAQLPLADIESVCTLSLPSSLGTAHLWSKPNRTLGLLPKLRTIHLRHSTLVLSHLASQIVPTESQSRSDGTNDADLNQATKTPNVFFPELSTLVIQDVEFDGKTANLLYLQHFLADRICAGKAISTLRIFNCEGLEDGQIDELREMVCGMGLIGRGLVVL
ncbi:hypothetical protein AX16_007456 [Volvariella volvacea WC 439]|nr:hypothetical protein AX16_007456 [Volvariella volvacea WC 439]